MRSYLTGKGGSSTIGTFTHVREHQFDIPEGPSLDNDKDEDDDDNNNRDNNGNGGEDSKSPDINRKVGDKCPCLDKDDNDDDNDNRDNNGNGCEDTKSPDVNRKVEDKRPPDTDATVPLPTSELARQADDLQALLNVFPNGH